MMKMISEHLLERRAEPYQQRAKKKSGEVISESIRTQVRDAS